MNKNVSLDVGKKIEMMISLIESIILIHKNGIIHKNIKP